MSSTASRRGLQFHLLTIVVLVLTIGMLLMLNLRPAYYHLPDLAADDRFSPFRQLFGSPEKIVVYGWPYTCAYASPRIAINADYRSIEKGPPPVSAPMPQSQWTLYFDDNFG